MSTSDGVKNVDLDRSWTLVLINIMKGHYVLLLHSTITWGGP